MTAGLPPLAVGAVLLGAVLHASWNTAVRAGRDRRRETALVVGGATVLAACILPFLQLPHPAAWKFLGISATLHVGYFVLLAEAYVRGDMSLAYPVMRGTAPMLTALAAWALLGEALPPAGWVGIVLICGGVSLMAQRRGAPGENAALRIALCNCVVIAAYTLNDAEGARASGTPFAYSMWLFALTALPTIAILTRLRPGRVSVREAVRALGGGACTISAYGLALWAMTVAQVAPVAALREVSMLVGVALARVVLGERVGARRWIAAAAIAAGAAVVRLG